MDAKGYMGKTCVQALVLCNTHSDGYSLVAAGHLRRQRYSPCPQAGLRSLPCIWTYWHCEMTHHSRCYKALGCIGQSEPKTLWRQKAFSVTLRRYEAIDAISNGEG